MHEVRGMNFGRVAAMLASAAVLVVASAVALPVGFAATPPVRLGLWEVESTTTLTSALKLQLPPEQAEQMKRMGIPVPGSPTTRTDRSCLDERSFDRLGEPDHGRSCHRENVQLSSQGLSADIVCDADGNKGRGHLDLVFDNVARFHGGLDMKGSSRSMPGINGVDVRMQGHWIGAECGSVKPLGGG